MRAAEQKPTAPAVRAMQLKELQRRLSAVTYPLRQQAQAKARRPETPALKRQRAALKKFDDANYSREQRASKTLQTHIDDVRNTILFGDVQKALRAIEKMEAEARNA